MHLSLDGTRLKTLPMRLTALDLARLRSSGLANRYQVLDNVVASRGLLLPGGITLDPASVAIYDASSVATPTGRPRGFDKKPRKGTSDHLPITAQLTYQADIVSAPGGGFTGRSAQTAPSGDGGRASTL